MNRHLWLASGLVALTLTGCMVRAQPVVGVSATVTPVEYEPVYPAAPPPAPIAEYRTPPPGYGYVWVDGYWDWTGYDWAWSQGSWAPERVGYRVRAAAIRLRQRPLELSPFLLERARGTARL